jgi:hypothetical protein
LIYVFREGRLVAKKDSARVSLRSELPMPMLSRMEPFESPVTGKEISSWRERDRDMAAANAVDPRDFSDFSKGRAAQLKKTKNG